MKTKILRCAYAIYPPGLIRDPNTGVLSGIFHDLIEEVGRQNGLKVQWAEEVDYGTIIEGFEAGRYDAFCAPIWPSPERAQRAIFSIPLYFSGVGIYVRADDHRFDGDIAKLNDAQYRFSLQDGDVGDSIAKEDFPRALRGGVPQMAPSSQRFIEVQTKKADALLDDPDSAAAFLKNHPGSLRNIVANHPVRLFPNVFMLNGGELQLKTMLDTVLQELVYQGGVHKLIEKYAGPNNGFYEAAVPFQTKN